jgi:hypothetical protein
MTLILSITVFAVWELSPYWARAITNKHDTGCFSKHSIETFIACSIIPHAEIVCYGIVLTYNATKSTNLASQPEHKDARFQYSLLFIFHIKFPLQLLSFLSCLKVVRNSSVTISAESYCKVLPTVKHICHKHNITTTSHFLRSCVLFDLSVKYWADKSMRMAGQTGFRP